MAKKTQKKALAGKAEKTAKTGKTEKKNQKKTPAKGADTEKPLISGAIVVVEEKEVDEEKLSPDALEALLDDEEAGGDEMDLDSDDDSEDEEADWE